MDTAKNKRENRQTEQVLVNALPSTIREIEIPVNGWLNHSMMHACIIFVLNLHQHLHNLHLVLQAYR
jgi:hypothetical protein